MQQTTMFVCPNGHAVVTWVHPRGCYLNPTGCPVCSSFMSEVGSQASYAIMDDHQTPATTQDIRTAIEEGKG